MEEGAHALVGHDTSLAKMILSSRDTQAHCKGE